MGIHSSTVDAVKAYPGIIALISEYVSLKKKGRNYSGLCPFHSEKSPSFYVNEEKQFYHCFGCQESGDKIAFLMKMDNLTFPETIKTIALKAGIEYKETEPLKKDDKSTEKEALRDACFEALIYAKDYYKRELKEASEAREYLVKRGLNQETIESFQIGYSPNSSQKALHYFTQKGLSKAVLCQCGLFYQQDNGEIVARFRDRVLFPVTDHLGKTLGFGGRRVNDQSNQAKYINSPDSIIFNKGRLLYGLYEAKKHTKSTESLIIMEGYMDVVMAHQYGVQTAVAPMGTALTQLQAQLIKRYVKTVYFGFDSDDAGQSAIDKSYDMVKEMDVSVKVLAFDQKDPADVLKEEGRAQFDEILLAAKPMIQYKTDQWLGGITIESSIEQKTHVINQIVPYLKAEKEVIIQSHYISEIAKKMSIERELILAKIKKMRYTTREKYFTPNKVVKDKYQKSEEIIICKAIVDKPIRRQLKDDKTETLFLDTNRQALLSKVLASDADEQELLGASRETDKRILSALLMEINGHVSPGIKKTDWEDCINTLKTYWKDVRIGEIKSALTNNTTGNDQALLEELNELMILK